jgi:hypothetical protein
MGSSYLPPTEQNVVNVGDEISASALAGIQAANPGLSAQNPVASVDHVDGRINAIQLTPGPAGPAGANGQPGPAGADGQQGPAGPAGTQWTYRGEYDGGITYNTNDYVSFQGSSYAMINFIGAAGYDPVSYPGSWQLVASRGANGSDGSNGSDGQPGPQGNDGPQGPAGQAVYNWRGSFDYYTYYNHNDVVSYDGSSYVSTGGSSNQNPYEGSSYWALIARRGDNGSQGSDGSQGPEGPAGPGVINWRGEYNYWDYYNQNDAVSYNGSSYICTYSHSSSYPDSGNYWGMLAQKGDTGATGADGSGGSSPSYYNSVWAYGTWYSANVTSIYDSNSYNYYNVLTF